MPAEGRVPHFSSGNFWQIIDGSRYDQARNQLMDLAKAYGITVSDSTPLLRELRPYRRPDDLWHFAGSRYEDYGLAIKWQFIAVRPGHCSVRVRPR